MPGPRRPRVPACACRALRPTREGLGRPGEGASGWPPPQGPGSGFAPGLPPGPGGGWAAALGRGGRRVLTVSPEQDDAPDSPPPGPGQAAVPPTRSARLHPRPLPAASVTPGPPPSAQPVHGAGPQGAQARARGRHFSVGSQGGCICRLSAEATHCGLPRAVCTRVFAHRAGRCQRLGLEGGGCWAGTVGRASRRGVWRPRLQGARELASAHDSRPRTRVHCPGSGGGWGRGPRVPPRGPIPAPFPPQPCSCAPNLGSPVGTRGSRHTVIWDFSSGGGTLALESPWIQGTPLHGARVSPQCTKAQPDGVALRTLRPGQQVGDQPPGTRSGDSR